MNKSLSIKFLFRILFSIISIVGLVGYLIYKPALEQQPIIYQVVDKVKQGGRGKYYVLSVNYRGTVYKVNITSKMYNEIDKGRLPNLYYSETYGKIISEWTIKIFIRVSVLFLILTLITFAIPSAAALKSKN